MFFDPGTLFMLSVFVAVTGIVTVTVTRVVIGTWFRRGEGGVSATGRLAKMEERILRIEEATSGLVAEFAAVRERERFMTQLVESRARTDAAAANDRPSTSSQPARGHEPSPFEVQTVSAVRRIKPV
jgi:hypothetical protein